MNYSLRASHYHKAAIKQYLNAARSDINYLNHSHWWAEIAGCFFLIGKYKWSEKCYRKAISLNELYIPVKALLADALFYQGKFEEAFQEIDKYITDTKYPVCEYKLKKYIFDFFKDNFTDRSRGIDKAIILVDRAISISNPKETLSLLEEAIECDPLCGLAWHNYSVTVSESNKSDSWWFWLITVVLQNWDIESWICLYVYMFICLYVFMISSEKEVPPEIIVLTINQAILIFNERFIDELYENLIQIQKYDKSEADELIANTREVYNNTKIIYAQDEELLYRVYVDNNT